MATPVGMFTFLLKLYADAGDQGPTFHGALNRRLARADLEIVKRSDQIKDLVVVTTRWIIKGTFA